jgi:outer membrane protein OmpA-like peptidoglycan-associated protein
MPPMAHLYCNYMVFFDTDSVAIASEHKRILKNSFGPEGNCFAHLRQLGSEAAFTITGGTDQTGTAEYNMALSRARAEAVRDYLTSVGVPESAMRLEATGDTKPVIPGVKAERFNRRAEISLTLRGKGFI